SSGFGTSINQTLTATTSSSGTATYTITPSASGCNGTPIVVVVTVDPVPNVVALPASQTICSGATTSIALSTTNGVGGASYSWTRVDSGVSGALVGSGASINETLTATGSTAGTATYTITPAAGGCNGTAITVIVTVNPLPNVVAAPASQTICSGTNSSISLSTTNGVAGATYSWTVVQSNVSGASSGFGTSINQTLTATTSSSGTATYTITPSASGCNGTAIVVVVTVSPAPRIINTPLTVTRCSGVGPLNFTPVIDVAGSSYSWTSSISGPITPASITAGGTSTIIDNPINIGSVAGTVTYTIVATGPGSSFCVGSGVNYVVTVNPAPVGSNDVKTVCSDIPVDYNLLLNIASLGNNVGSTFSWVATDNPNPLVTGESTIAIVGPIITDVITNLTNTNQNVVYTVTPTSTSGCAGAPFQITITIKPEPVGFSATAPDICSGASVNYNLQNNVNTFPGNNLATNFTWTATTQPNVTGETTSLKSGSLIDDVLVNTTTINQTVTYTVTPTSQVGGCAGDPFTIQVNVNPKAIFSAGPNLSVCVSENDIEIQGSVTFSPAPYSWSGGAFNDNTLEKPRYLLSAADKAVITPTTKLLTITVPAAGVCAAEMKSMTLTIYPLPNASFFGIPSPPEVPENGPPLVLSGTQNGGLFTITPGTGLSATTIDPGTNRDQASLTPNTATLYDGTPSSINIIKYAYTDGNGCTNSSTQNLRVNALTVVDFAVQNATTDGSGEFLICADSGDILLIPLDGGNPGQAPETGFASLTPGLTLNQIGSQYFIPTNGLPSGTYTVQFTYKNIAGVISNKQRNIKVQASPVALFSYSGSCINSPTTFTDASTLNPTPFPTTLSISEWNFGDQTPTISGLRGSSYSEGGTYKDPSHTYGVANSYTVSLKVTTAQGCSNKYISLPDSIVVGTIPVVNFDYFNICNNDSTRFVSAITNLGASSVKTYKWDFDDGDTLSGVGNIPAGTHGDRTIRTYDIPLHKYNTNGSYNPSLTVVTNRGCESLPKVRPVEISAYLTMLPGIEDFENDKGDFFSKDIINPDDSTFVSWKHGPPTGLTINSSINGNNVWWTGKNSNSYFSNEKSAAYSPCYNLTQTMRPMVALDYFSDLEANLDGVVLQYSVDGGAVWSIVGPLAGLPNRDEGINWFNGISIPSNPGNQLIGQYGWTNATPGVKQAGWKNARFNLDMIPKIERDQVRFRFAIGSNDTNASNETFDGFAFDNFLIGEKPRLVLVEHFTTSTLVGSVNADSYLNGLYQQQFTVNRDTSDFEHIQYHVNFAGVDAYNKDNPTDPAARALFFGASQPPYTIMDGLLVPGKFTGITTQLNKIELDRRALVEPPFLLSLKDTTSISSETISVKMVIEATKDWNSPVIINVALVEKNIGGVMRVLRKNLFGSDGETINLGFIKGQKVQKVRMDVPIDVPISNPNGLMLIGYVQDKNTKEIYQSIAINGPVKNGSPVVGIEDEQPAVAALNSIQLFPNPANLEFTFGLPAHVHPSSQWRIIDQRGVTVLEGNFEDAVNGLKQVSVAELANAVYFVVMTGPNGATVRKKLIVLNRN
ncbi:MAG: hypothetical protein JNM78_09200, partial [Cyclobacteriaceae bacterium]|nr:hypothetical protein [Cyclobacteriaceae bacterium]